MKIEEGGPQYRNRFKRDGVAMGSYPKRNEESVVSQSHPILCNPMKYSPAGSSDPGIL